MIKISGKKTIFKPFLKDVAEFIFSELDLSHQGVEVNVIIIQKTHVINELKNFGFTRPSLVKRRGKKARIYEVFIDGNTGVALMVKYIAHELIHVRQLEQGQLVCDMSKSCLVWPASNFSISMSRIDEINEIEEYKLLPWESEAYSLSEELFVSCKAKFAKAEYDLGGITTTIF